MYRIRARFSKGEEVKYISHLDLVRTFERAIRRGKLPVAFTKGFRKTPRLVFTPPLPLGATSDAEYIDVYLEEELGPEILRLSLNRVLPRGIYITKTFAVALGGPALPSIVEASLFQISSSRGIPSSWVEAIPNLLACPKVIVERVKKKQAKKIDIRPFIYSVQARGEGTNSILELFLATGGMGGTKPSEVLTLLAGEQEYTSHPCNWHRLGLFIKKDGLFQEPEQYQKQSNTAPNGGRRMR